MATLPLQFAPNFCPAPRPGELFHTVRMTAAADVPTPIPGMYLTHILLAGTAGAVLPGNLAILYDGTAQAMFPVHASTIAANPDARIYQVDWQVRGTLLPAAAFTFTGIAIVVLVFSNMRPQGHPPMEEYRGLLFRRTDAGAVTGDVTVNFAAAPGKPRKLICSSSPGDGRAAFRNVGPTQAVYEAVGRPFAIACLTAPDLPAANSLTLSLITDAAATIQAVVYY